jgi:hypothetical protein
MLFRSLPNMPHRARAAVIAATLALAGCATQYQIAEQSTKANRAVEDAQNQVLLLNVIRAYKQRPTYLTAISKVAGPIGTATPSAALSLPFGVDAPRVFNLTPTARADAPNFDVAVLDTHNFMRGFLQPVAPATVKLYLDEGWPAHFLLSLFIREIRRPDGSAITNSPLKRRAFEEFSADLKRLVDDCGLHIESRPVKVGPLLDAGAVKANLATLIAMQKDGMELREVVGHGYQLQKPNAMPVFTVNKTCNMRLAVAGEAGKPNGAQDEHVIVLRSPEAVLTYLGELARAQLQGAYGDAKQAYVPQAWAGEDHAEPMFVLKAGDPGDGEAVVKVEYEDVTYYVPRDAAGGRSMQALSLLAQLIGLQKNAAELPTTTSVRVMNP